MQNHNAAIQFIMKILKGEKYHTVGTFPKFKRNIVNFSSINSQSFNTNSTR